MQTTSKCICYRYRDVRTTASNIESCAAVINDWMAFNRLKLNPWKTKLVWLAQGLIKNQKVPIEVGQVTSNHATFAKSLEIILDDDLKLIKHV